MSDPEKGQIPPVEKYNKKKYYKIITDPVQFRMLLPDIFEKIVKEEDPQDSSEEVNKVRNRIRSLWFVGNKYLLASISMKFAYHKGWLINRKMIIQDNIEIETLPLPMHYDEFSDDQKLECEDYLKNVPRNEAILALIRLSLIHKLPTLDIQDPEYITLNKNLKRIPYLLALRIFPDLKDKEFEGKPVAEVRRLAEDI